MQVSCVFAITDLVTTAALRAVFLPSQTWSQRQRWQLCFCHHRLGHNGSTDSCVFATADLVTTAALTAVFLPTQTWSQWQRWQLCFCHHRLGHNGSADSCVSAITDLVTTAALTAMTLVTAVFLSSQTWSQWQHWQLCFCHHRLGHNGNTDSCVFTQLSNINFIDRLGW